MAGKLLKTLENTDWWHVNCFDVGKGGWSLRPSILPNQITRRNMHLERTHARHIEAPTFQVRWLLPVSLKTALLAIFALNIFDTFATLTWVFKSLAYEANPLMASLLYNTPHLFVVLKLSLAGLGCILLWRLRQRPAVTFASQCLLVVYSILGFYHLQGFSLLMQ